MSVIRRFAPPFCVLLAILSFSPLDAATFTVNTTNDIDDGTCDATHCSLREAINAANASAGLDSIEFNVGGGGQQTIQPASFYPSLTDSVVIDGTTQPGYAGSPLIELNGSLITGGANGLGLFGGSSTIRGLVINGFSLNAIVTSGGTAHLIEDNYLGTNAAGTAAVPNGANGIQLNSNNDLVRNNLVSGNSGFGIGGGTQSIIQGNLVGTDITGTLDLGNGSVGVVGRDGLIGGSTPAERNVISGNGIYGIELVSSGAVVSGNYIGTNATGTAAIPNDMAGIRTFNRANNTIGGTTPGTGNLISGHTSGIACGIWLQGTGSTGNVIQGNSIGTNATGTGSINNGAGICLAGASGTLIGGTSPGARNIVSGNGTGIDTNSSDANFIQGNYIGLDPTGTSALPNGSGVMLGGDGNLLGGSAPGAGNVISGNTSVGVYHNNTAQSGNRIQGNKIGTDPAGLVPIPNPTGIALGNASMGTLIGGSSPGEGNLIAFSTNEGIQITFASQHTISGNSIHSNGGLGIDLWDGSFGTVTANDPNDADTGFANNLQNYPSISAVSSGGGTTVIDGSLQSAPSTTFTIEFFANSACDPSGYGEGETFLGSDSVTTDGTGNVTFSTTLAATVTAGQSVTATATDPSGNSSEFSACFSAIVVSSADLSLAKTAPATVDAGSEISYVLMVTNNGFTDASDLVLTDLLPFDVTFVSASGTNWACSESAGEVTCTRTSLFNGASSSVTIVVAAPPEAATLTNTASVTGTEPDPDFSNNSGTATTQVVPSIDLELAKTANVTTAQVGDEIRWIVTMSNRGPSTLDRSLFVEDRLPAQLEFVSASGFYWKCSESRGLVRCRNTRTLGSGGSMSFTVQTLARESGMITNTATVFASEDPDRSNNRASASVDVAPGGPDCTTLPAPIVSVPGEVDSGERYVVSWPEVPGALGYELQESGSSSFAGAMTITTTATDYMTSMTVTTAQAFYYRVRASCEAGVGPWSRYVRIAVVPPGGGGGFPGASTQLGNTGRVTTTVTVLPPVGAGKTARAIGYVARTDRSWMSVSPVAGTIPPEGRILTVSMDPALLPAGTHTGTVLVEFESGSPSLSQASVASIPVSLNLVTPVTPVDARQPSDESLIIPAVAHASGVDSTWRSDVRIANVSESLGELTLRLSTPGDATVRETTLEIEGGATTALDDVVRQWYGLGSLGEDASGYLQIDPTDEAMKGEGQALALATVVSSRTYNVSSTGTFGQFIPALRFGDFIGLSEEGKGPSRLSLQHIEQTEAFRTNVGLVESAGEPASVEIRVFDSVGNEAATFVEDLGPGEHRQLNSVLESRAIELENGRIELRVIDGAGRVGAYASLVDNVTNDPLLIRAVDPTAISASRYVVAGVADLTNEANRWRTDLRVYNASTTPAVATLTFHPQEAPAEAHVVQLTFEPGQVVALDGILENTFGMKDTGGAVHIETASMSSLVVTGRTFNVNDDGSTLGQFIPAVTEASSVGMGERSLQVLQVEESSRFRSNLGISEVVGSPATVEVTAVAPELLGSPTMVMNLQGNEFVQLTSVLSRLGLGTVYNGRITVRVIDGSGRISAYASVVDNASQDPTFIPAQ